MDSQVKRKKRQTDYSAAIEAQIANGDLDANEGQVLTLQFDAVQDIERNTESIAIALAKLDVTSGS